jgi:hypothetical protein
MPHSILCCHAHLWPPRLYQTFNLLSDSISSLKRKEDRFNIGTLSIVQPCTVLFLPHKGLLMLLDSVLLVVLDRARRDQAVLWLGWMRKEALGVNVES